MNKKRLINYQEQLLKKLQNEEFATIYLNEALSEGDPRMFLLALKNVIAAQEENISSIAKEANLTRTSIYRILSEKGNPKLINIISLLNSVGLHLSVQSNKPR